MKRLYCIYCGNLLEENCDCKRIAAEEAKENIENYENSPETHLGWSQQDLIDSYKRER